MLPSLGGMYTGASVGGKQTVCVCSHGFIVLLWHTE